MLMIFSHVFLLAVCDPSPLIVRANREYLYHALLGTNNHLLLEVLNLT